MISRCLDYSFDVDYREAVLIQNNLTQYLSLKFPFDQKWIRLIAGVDVSYEEKDIACAVIIILSYPELELVEVVHAREKVHFPYVPGFLSFREGPVVSAALQLIKNGPQIFFFDGQGIAHPRGLGLASHMGVLYNITSIGVAKSNLVGKYDEPPPEKGQYSWIQYHDRPIGAALRTRSGVKPIFVSPGHRIDFQNAIDWTMRVTRKYRIPEPTRIAHQYSEKLKKK